MKAVTGQSRPCASLSVHEDVPRGPEIKARTATWGKYVKKNIPATIPREIRIPLKMVGNNGWINVGSGPLATKTS